MSKLHALVPADHRPSLQDAFPRRMLINRELPRAEMPARSASWACGPPVERPSVLVSFECHFCCRLTVGKSLRNHHPEFHHHAPNRIGQLRPLPNQQLPGTEHHRAGLGLDRLHRNAAHGGSGRRLHDRRSIVGVVLLPLDEGLDLHRRNQFHLVSHSTDLATPVMGSATGLQRHRASWQLAEKRKQLGAAAGLSKDRFPGRVGAMDGETRLRRVDADHGTILHVWFHISLLSSLC